MKQKRYFVFLVSMLLIFTFTLQGFASDTTGDQKKLNQITQQIKNFQKKMTENKKQEKNLTTQIKTLDQKIDQTEQEIGDISTQITMTKAQIDKTRAELNEAENKIAGKKNVLNARLRVMYKNGNVGYAEVLLASANIVDFFSKLDMVQKVIDHDTGLLKYMKEQREAIDAKKKKLEAYEGQMVSMKNKMEVKQDELELSRGQAAKAKEQVQKDNVALEKQIDDLNQYAQKIADEIRRKQSKGEYTGGQMAWPAPGYTRITSPFGYRIHPILKTKKLHTGIDIGIPLGKDVVAAGDGTVIHSDWLGGYGKVIMIDHGGGIVTLYAHNSSLVAKDGAKVKRGQVISKAGSTGLSTGPHLHFEVRKNGDYVDPIPWVK
ncbi:murein DD-endopeptidase MepM/ murein hydrolase activator NlpD [Anaerosolibacter carboniphilus]|uniref:Murein DD-endopeptidase MepM/ murein hydrolase activator NlpD n=1 Tax=Anaerosolibacter carboniphilus TaxID=1417629 RepID=A0A841KQS9_9FIRM|nr:peptidoglycan DD-metalloendopeptidase family protein [Anaerosolibacter carboniphilus]MBB6215773.1 murein DD-endopeptidase MepM/ murein hydrolase activator NlpD [Anaerosolibacter carboniphilus]